MCCDVIVAREIDLLLSSGTACVGHCREARVLLIRIAQMLIRLATSFRAAQSSYIARMGPRLSAQSASALAVVTFLVTIAD